LLADEKIANISFFEVSPKIIEILETVEHNQIVRVSRPHEYLTATPNVIFTIKHQIFHIFETHQEYGEVILCCQSGGFDDEGLELIRIAEKGFDDLGRIYVVFYHDYFRLQDGLVGNVLAVY
jgi:hypothetical protein